MIHTLDTYQKEAIDILKKSKISILSGNKSSGKSYLIRFLLNERWHKGKSTLVVIPDMEQAKLFQRHLGEFGLSKYSFVFDNSKQLSENDIARIKSVGKEEKVEVPKKSIKFNNLYKEDTLNKIKTYFDILNNKVLFNKSLSELIQISAFDVKSFKNIHFNQVFETDLFDFNEQEFTQIQKNIQLASELLQKGENKTDIYFIKKAYVEKNAEKNWIKISNWLKESRINILKVIQSISGFLHEQSVEQFNLKWKNIRNVLYEIERILLQIDSFNIQFEDFDQNQSNLFGLDKQYKEQKEQFQLANQKIIIDYKAIVNELSKFPSIKDNYILPNINETEISTIYNSLKKLTDEFSILEDLLKQSIRKELKSMNFRNIRNEALDNIQTDLKNMFGLLNNGFANIKWEDNAFSINKQLNYLEAILEDLNKLEGQKINFFNNFNWNNLLNNIDEKSIYLIRKFNIYRPKNWMLFFKNYFIQNLILNYKHLLDKNINKEIKTLLDINAKQETLKSAAAKRIWQNKRKIVLNKFKNDSNNIIPSIFNQINTSYSLNEIINQGKEFFTEFFPVIITTPEIVPDLRNYIQDNFDTVIFENSEKYKDSLTDIIPEHFNGQLIFTLDDKEALNTIKKATLNKNSTSEIQTSELKGYHQQGMINLLDMNYTERLYAARNLAHLMQSANEKIKIFQMKNTVIFSALDDILNKVLFKVLDKTGIKEMRIIDTPFHLLVDNLLEVNGKQILLTQNNLLNYKSFENIIWQQKAIEKIAKGGIKVVNINTSELLNNPVERIKSFIQDNLL